MTRPIGLHSNCLGQPGQMQIFPRTRHW